MKWFCSIMTLTCLPYFLWAQNKIGNGGDVVFCQAQKSKEKTARLLDFYEEEIQFESTEKDPYVIAEIQINKLKAAAPSLSESYLRRLKEMRDLIEFKKDVKLTNIKDSHHLFKPLSEDCKILQLAIRRSSLSPGEKLFLIREDMWSELPPVHKAGLLTHEIIYEHFSKLQEQDSIKARRVNRFLYQKELSGKAFWEMIRDLKLPLYP